MGIDWLRLETVQAIRTTSFMVHISITRFLSYKCYSINLYIRMRVCMYVMVISKFIHMYVMYVCMHACMCVCNG